MGTLGEKKMAVECFGLDCDNEFEIPEDEQFGGNCECPRCGQKYEIDFETNCGVILTKILE